MNKRNFERLFKASIKKFVNDGNTLVSGNFIKNANEVRRVHNKKTKIYNLVSTGGIYGCILTALCCTHIKSLKSYKKSLDYEIKHNALAFLVQKFPDANLDNLEAFIKGFDEFGLYCLTKTMEERTYYDMGYRIHKWADKKGFLFGDGGYIHFVRSLEK